MKNIRAIKKIYDSPWDFAVYEVEGGYAIVVAFCKSFCDTEAGYMLKSVEPNFSFDQFKSFAHKIRKDTESFKDRLVSVDRSNLREVTK